ncbi:hypothetical protein BD769DRAFT_1388571 [Suillus cothurnatus]|nr:hypothetical protein BD769DRAFT_1388571 [Suillus cothurnatus]
MFDLYRSCQTNAMHEKNATHGFLCCKIMLWMILMQAKYHSPPHVQKLFISMNTLRGASLAEYKFKSSCSDGFNTKGCKSLEVLKSDIHILGLKTQRVQVEVDMLSEAIAHMSEFKHTDDVVSPLHSCSHVTQVVCSDEAGSSHQVTSQGATGARPLPSGSSYHQKSWLSLNLSWQLNNSYIYAILVKLYYACGHFASSCHWQCIFDYTGEFLFLNSMAWILGTALPGPVAVKFMAVSMRTHMIYFASLSEHLVLVASSLSVQFPTYSSVRPMPTVPMVQLEEGVTSH